MIEIWVGIWAFAYEHYIFHTIVIAAIVYIVFFPGGIRRVFKGLKKIKAGPGGIEFETSDSNINPDTPCPYKKSRDISFGAIRKVEDKVDKLSAEMREVIAIVKNMSIDQQKSSFYDTKQPEAERLAAGLKYIYQGGNGQTKPDVIAFAEAHKDFYNALTSVKPELRLVYQGGGV